ncbi:MAG: polyribonucleotide nucleotidyltransferase [Syntrophales bacterium]|nr:polyribonucleotide nucleotidyltransferase [Syntrophales bacterium]
MSDIFACEFAGREISIKTNYMAGQADGACLVRYGDTVVLVTVVSTKTGREGLDFLPLTVDYQELTYAAGKIPGGFFKREGRPNEREILTSRMIDRSIRPLIPKGYFFETQIIASLFSVDADNDPAVAAMIGTSAALCISDVPFKGPVVGVRLGKVDGRLIVNPSQDELEKSEMDLFISGRKGTLQADGTYTVDLVMVEGEAKEVGEEEIVEAIGFALEAMRPVIELQENVRAAVGKPKRPVTEVEIAPDLIQAIEDLAVQGIQSAYRTARKQERQAMLREVRDRVLEKVTSENLGSLFAANQVLDGLERRVMREMIIKEGRRIDGRTEKEIRPITAEVGILPRAHGSALFNRGETQALVTLTLGTAGDEQRLDFVLGEEMRSFMLHYNFPPYCVGEAKPLRSPGRREIGHGNLARRALLPILPDKEKFPYTIRLVSDILSSNGSSSMATVCGGTLALMDGGVPIRDQVAGIAMGLLKEGDRVVVLSDILGDEDHAGDMDFKVCGTEKGVTAMQMDIKIDGITSDILRQALAQAREGRLFILEKLKSTLPEPRKDISAYAPRITTVKVKPEKIRDVIGAGGKNIRQIISETGVTIDVEDDGTVTIASNDAKAAARAVEMVKWLTEDAEVGRIYRGTVKKVVDFGAIVEILPGTEGLVHISQLDRNRVRKVTDIVREGDEILVKVLEIDKQGKIRLSRKEALGENVP